MNICQVLECTSVDYGMIKTVLVYKKNQIIICYLWGINSSNNKYAEFALLVHFAGIYIQQ